MMRTSDIKFALMELGILMETHWPLDKKEALVVYRLVPCKDKFSLTKDERSAKTYTTDDKLDAMIMGVRIARSLESRRIK